MSYRYRELVHPRPEAPMRDSTRLALALAVAAVFGPPAAAQAPPPAVPSRLAVAGPTQPAARAAQADVIVLGRVVEVEKDPVEAAPFKGAPKDQRASYK